MQLEFPGEVNAQCVFSFRYFGSEEFEVYGTDGYIRMKNAWNNEDHSVNLEIKKRDGKDRSIKFAPIYQFTEQLQHMCECLNTGRAHRISYEDSLNNMKVIDAVHASIDMNLP